MKLNFQKLILSLILVVGGHWAMAQQTISNNLLMIKFTPNVRWDSIQLLKTRYGAEQLDSTSHLTTNVKLWRLPTQIIQQYQSLSKIIDDIDGSYNGKKPIRTCSDSLYWFTAQRVSNTACTNSPLPTCSVNTQNKSVRVAYLDTGMDIDPRTGNPKNPLLAEYFNKTLSKDLTGGNSITDVNGHGTGMGNILAQVLKAGGIRGTGSEVISLKVFDNQGYASPWAIVKGIDYCMQQNIRVVNLSINWKSRKLYNRSGALKKTVLEQVIEAAANNNITVVCAAGNDARNIDRNADTLFYYPSNFTTDNLLTVAATDCANKLTTHSNWGLTSVDFGAIGANFQTIGLNNTVINQSGSSIASSYVAGLVAVKTAHRALENEPLSMLQLRQAVLNQYAVAGHSSLNGKLARPEVLKLTCSRALSKGEQGVADNLEWNVFPNPVVGVAQIQVELPQDADVELCILDMYGRNVLTRTAHVLAGLQSLQWDTTGLIAGMYVVNLKIEGHFYNQKIVVNP